MQSCGNAVQHESLTKATSTDPCHVSYDSDGDDDGDGEGDGDGIAVRLSVWVNVSSPPPKNNREIDTSWYDVTYYVFVSRL